MLLAGCLVAAAACGQAGPAPTAGEAATDLAGTDTPDSVYEQRSLAGFTLMVNRGFITDDPALLARVMLHLEADLDEITHLVPAPSLAALRQTTIWVELQGLATDGMSGRGLCCHWSAEWVTSHGMPAEKAGGVEIVNAEDYVRWHTTQPYMLLHELAHAYHRMLGAETPEIVDAYKAAMEAGIYAEVDRNSAVPGEKVRAYAATNHHEYFAEVSEAYLALNDFAPYTRSQLGAMDPRGLSMAETLWNLAAGDIAARMTATGLVDPP
jgi:hypothetical protein